MHWTRHQKGGFKRHYHAAVAVGHKVYSFGGALNPLGQIDVHVYNTMSWLWVKLPPVVAAGEEDNGVPSMRYGHTAVLIEDTIYIWGGRTGTGKYSNELYAFDVDTHTWSKPKVSGPVPAARWLHSACVLGKDVYIHGGSGAPGHSYGDIHKLDTTTMVWSLIDAQGTPVSNHTATIIGTRIFVFGGYSYSYRDYFGNKWSVFDTETNCWLPTPAQRPEMRWGHSAFAYKGELYIFGGDYNDHQLDDFWKYNPKTCSWTLVEPNGESLGPWAPLGYSSGPMTKMCCCMVGNQIILFGGHIRSDDLYILDLSPSLKSLCMLAVVQHGLEQSGLPHDIRLELSAMTTEKRLELFTPPRRWFAAFLDLFKCMKAS